MRVTIAQWMAPQRDQWRGLFPTLDDVHAMVAATCACS